MAHTAMQTFATAGCLSVCLFVFERFSFLRERLGMLKQHSNGRKTAAVEQSHLVLLARSGWRPHK